MVTNSNLKFRIVLFCINTIILIQALPIEKYKELDCSAQDNKVVSSGRVKRAAKSLFKYPIWPNGIVHYTIECPNFHQDELHLIKAALNEIESKTCVKFINIKGSSAPIKSFIRVQCKDDGGCKAELGYQGRPQILNLQLRRARNEGGCMTMRKIQHEFMHSLGFRHEHNSPIRDQYVKILKQNIAKGWDYYFQIDNPTEYENYGCTYDYKSIMQVDGYRHSGNKQPTIIPVDKTFSVDTIGRSLSISACDVTRIRTMYCNNVGTGNARPANNKTSNNEHNNIGNGNTIPRRRQQGKQFRG